MKMIRSKLFIKNFITFIIPSFITIIILGTLSFWLTYNYIENGTKENNLNLLNQLKGNVELVANDVNYLTQIYSANSYSSVALKHIFNNDTLNYSDLIQLQSIRDVLNSSANFRQNVYSIYIYINNANKKFLSTYDNLVTIDSFRDKEWYTNYLKVNTSINQWIELRKIPDGVSKTGYINALTVYHRIYSTESIKPDGILVYNIKLNYLQQSLDNLITLPNQKIYVIDDKKNILLNSSNNNLSKNALSPNIKDIISNKNFSSSSTFTSDNYTISKVYSDQYKLAYVSVIPSSILYSVSRNLLNITLLLLFISFIIGILISYVFSKKSYSHVKDIISIIDSAEKGVELPPPPTLINDEYNYIIYSLIKAFIEQNYLKVQHEKRKYKLKTMEAIALQAQINPHFLFNTLETVSLKALALTKTPSEINMLIENLSDILRYSLTNPNETVTLEDEIENTKSYLYIQKVRYKDKFDVIWDYDYKIACKQIIKLVLQPLIENSIYHGVKLKEQRCKIKIKMKVKNGMLKISIIDSGVGISREKLEQIQTNLLKDDEHYKHIGLYNTNKRLRLFYGDEFGIKIWSKLGSGAIVSFEIPYNL